MKQYRRGNIIRNIADNLIYTTEKTLKEAGDKVLADVKKVIEEKVESLKKVKDSDNMEDIKNKTADLSQEIQKVGAELYKKAEEQKKAEGQQNPGEQKKPEEGEYKEK